MHTVPRIRRTVDIPIHIAEYIALCVYSPSSESFTSCQLLPATTRAKSFSGNIPDERFVTFGKITDLSRPIIHLYIDVAMNVTFPGRSIIPIPYPLQIIRQIHSTRRSDHQVSSILKIQHIQIKIFFMQAYQFICGNRGYFSLQIKPDAVEKRLIIIQVSGFQLLITFGRCPYEPVCQALMQLPGSFSYIGSRR